MDFTREQLNRSYHSWLTEKTVPTFDDLAAFATRLLDRAELAERILRNRIREMSEYKMQYIRRVHEQAAEIEGLKQTLVQWAKDCSENGGSPWQPLPKGHPFRAKKATDQEPEDDWNAEDDGGEFRVIWGSADKDGARMGMVIPNAVASNWIPVSDRLPHPGQVVLVSDSGRVTTAHWYASQGWECMVPWGDVYNITHWQPLPNPPGGRS